MTNTPKPTEPKPQVPKPSLWQRIRIKLFGGEGRIKDLFR